MRLSKVHGSRVALAVTVAWFASGCALAGGGAGVGEGPAVPNAPPIRQGLRDDNEARQAALLLADGEERLRDGRFDDARDRAAEVEARFPEAVGSSLALWLDARAAAGLGEWTESGAAVERYLGIVGPSGPFYAAALLARARALWETGSGAAFEALLDVPVQAGEDVLAQADSLAIEIARSLDTSTLRALADGPSVHPRFFPALVVELAVRRYLAGAETEARGLAERAIGMDPGTRVVDRARSVIEGRVDEDREGSGVVGAILAGTGSPTLRQLSQEIQEGIELALAEAGGAGPLRLVADEGDPGQVARAMEGFEREGAVGVVGPLMDPLLDAAARSRTGPIAIVSPTASRVPAGQEGVFSLAGLDPQASRALAALVLSQGLRDVVVVHPVSEDMTTELEWFREAYAEGGGSVSRVFTYTPGTTGFGPLLGQVRATYPVEMVQMGTDSTDLTPVALEPEGLVVLLPPGDGDVELLAPQISFYGLRDIVGLQLFGNQSWTDPAVLQGVQSSHTDGVLAVSSWPEEGEFGPAWSQFVEEYEEHFQRTLRTPTPALGYDAARLLIQGARLGGGAPAGTLRALREIRDFPGATGVLSIVDGRIVREYFPVRIQSRRLLPVAGR